MEKIVVIEWVTLDGVFDAQPEYYSEWFLPYYSLARQEWIRRKIESADTLLLGKTTYEMLAQFWSQQTDDSMGPAAKLNSMPKVVVSTTLKERIWQNTEKIISKNVVDEIKKLKKQQSGDILISGSRTLVLTLLEANLIDEIDLLIHPIIYGKGIKFFNEKLTVTKLNLIDTKQMDFGVIAHLYQVSNDKMATS